ncbi:hypothetical protein MBRA1_002199 [Malassezia brasiliensis]|uniref:Uncharacterized protein n=1 Tax=Malassezia brasiliensis TaxID=1821822 RepID=A0AAF0IQ19_9BASI|nr:hypothetical protein MBRA1_002199 [Malassezia brasiliensis]
MSASVARRARLVLRGSTAARRLHTPLCIATRSLHTDRARGVLLGAAQLFTPDSAWHTALVRQADDTRTSRRVVFAGASACDTAGVVDALLAEPHDAPITRALAAKNAAHAEHPEGLRIVYGDAHTAAPAPTPNTLMLPLPWLRAGVELIELLDPRTDTATLQTLYDADALFFVVDAAALSQNASHHEKQTLALVEHFAAKPGTTLVVNLPWREVAPTTPAPVGTSVARAADMPDLDAIARAAHAKLGARTLALLAAHSTVQGNAAPGVLAVSSALAAHAKSLLAPTHASIKDQWRQFSDSFRAARFPALYEAVVRPSDPRVRATYLAQTALETASVAEALEGERLRAAAGYAHLLNSEAQYTMDKLASHILAEEPVEDDARPSAVEVRRGDASPSVAGFLADSRHEVETVLAARFPWYKLPFRIDELRLTLLYTVGRSFGVDQETRLAYETGRMRGIAAEEYARTLATLRELARHERRADADTRAPALGGAYADAVPSFDSATLRNTLAAFDDAQLAPILTPTCLAEPLIARRRQLLGPQGPVDQLVARAQRATLHTYVFLGTTYTACAYGTFAHHRLVPRAPPVRPVETVPNVAELAATDWTPWSMPETLTHLAGLGDWLVMAPSTAGATALLATAAGAWYLQGRWSAAKRKFWKDWDRVVHAVDRDAKNEVNALLRYVFGAPLQAARTLRDACVGREAAHQERIEQLRKLREAKE